MKVENIIEHEDGSATITLHMSNKEHRTVMEGALIRGIALGLASKPDVLESFTSEEWRTIVNSAIEAKKKDAQ